MSAQPDITLLTAAEVARYARDALQGGSPVVSVLAIEAEDDDSDAVGRRILVCHDRVLGTLGNKIVDNAAIQAARDFLRGGEAAASTTGRETSGIPALYFEAHRPPNTLVIVGAGHIAQPLCRLGATLGYAVTVLDDRPEFATRERFQDATTVRRVDFADPFREIRLGERSHLVLVTRGHKYDYEALRSLLLGREEPAYVGMVGSRRRVRAAFEQLKAEGVPAERLARVHAPIGLDIGAETPAELAVCIAAELIKARRGGSGASLRDRERVVERWITERP